MLTNDVLNLSNDVIIEKKASDSLYAYTLGSYHTFEDAKKMKNYLATRGYEQAEIIPYYKGSTVVKDDIISLKHEYPELDKYFKDPIN